MPLSDIVGHAPLVALLRQAVSKNRVPQSLLFAGPEGVGKRAVAMALAQAVNCPRRQNGDACGTCATCQRIARGQHSDVTVLDRGDEASIKIPALRDRVLESVNYRPFEAARRVFIIDPADAMTVQAQDALLKTLEEPPSAAIIILVSAYADTLQPTILSRCRRLRFGLLVEADVARILKAQGIDAGAAPRLAARAGGTVSRALTGQNEFDEDRSAALGLLVAARGPAVLARLKASAVLTRHDSDRRDREALVGPAGRSVVAAARPHGNRRVGHAAARPCRSRRRSRRPRLGLRYRACLERVRHRRSRRRRPRSKRQPEARRGLDCGDDLRLESWGWVLGLEDMTLPVVAITVGDPSGIGPEIAVKASRDPRVTAVCRPVLYGPHTADAVASFPRG